MVKKIRVIEEEQDKDEELDNQEFQRQLLDYMHAIDWKLWEMTKIFQTWADREGFSESDREEAIENIASATPGPEDKAKSREKGIKSVIVDDEDE